MLRPRSNTAFTGGVRSGTEIFTTAHVCDSGGFLIILASTHIRSGANACSINDVECPDGRCIPEFSSNLCKIPATGSPQPSITAQILMSSQKPRVDTSGSVVTDGVTMASDHVVTSGSAMASGSTMLSGSTVTSAFIVTSNSVVTSGPTMSSGPVVTSGSVPPSGTIGQGVCKLGHIQCNDGRCEPYPSLCGEAGYSTPDPPVTYPTVVTVSGSPGVTNTPEVRTSLPTTTATPLQIATDSNGQEVCPNGWERCKDGVCEPFHWLCTEHDGTVTTSPDPLTTEAPTTTTTNPEPTMRVVTMIVSGMTVIVTQPVTLPNGGCPAGWEKCADGDYEPFHWLCAEHEGSNITMPTAGTLPPTTTRVTVPGETDITNIAGMSTVSATNAPTTTTQGTTTTEEGTTVVIPTDGTGACPSGWTLCSDAACEPYLHLCDDHVLSIIG